MNARSKQLEARATVTREVRAFFDSRGYLEVETPLAIPSPGLDLHLDAFAIIPTGLHAPTGDLSDVIESNRYALRFLSTSPEYQMKRLLVEGYPRIFQISRAFRVGEFGERHNPEFTILEFYRANAGLEAILRDTEQLVARVTGGWVNLGTRRIDVRPPFAQMTVCEAYNQFACIPPDETRKLAEHDEDRFFRILVDVVEPALAAIDHAVFLTEYPASQASLARKKPLDPRVAERFELYVAGVEVCNGFGELTDAAEQRTRFVHDQNERARRGKPVYPLDERFLEALARGMPESGGNAIGLDRLIALTTGSTSIRHVLAFADDEL